MGTLDCLLPDLQRCQIGGNYNCCTFMFQNMLFSMIVIYKFSSRINSFPHKSSNIGWISFHFLFKISFNINFVLWIHPIWFISWFCYSYYFMAWNVYSQMNFFIEISINIIPYFLSSNERRINAWPHHVDIRKWTERVIGNKSLIFKIYFGNEIINL